MSENELERERIKSGIHGFEYYGNKPATLAEAKENLVAMKGLILRAVKSIPLFQRRVKKAPTL